MSSEEDQFYSANEGDDEEYDEAEEDHQESGPSMPPLERQLRQTKASYSEKIGFISNELYKITLTNPDGYDSFEQLAGDFQEDTGVDAGYVADLVG
jgi:FtsZ-interacting cell division protein YlmF